MLNLTLQIIDNFLHVIRIHLRSPQCVSSVKTDALPVLIRAEKDFIYEQTERRICDENPILFQPKTPLNP